MAEGIADADLAEKGEAPPERTDALQQDALAHGGSLRPDEFGRLLRQRRTAGKPGDKEASGHGNKQTGSEHPATEMKDQILILIHDVIGKPDDIRQTDGSGEEAQQAAQQGGEPGIEQILGHDDRRGIAHGFEGADLGALLIYHAGHGGDTDQGGHKHKEHRKHHRDAVHDGAVVLKGNIAWIGRAVECKKLRLQRIFQFRLSVGQLLLCILQFLPCLSELAVSLVLAVVILHPASGQLLFRVLQLLSAGLERGAGEIQFHLLGGELDSFV